MTQVEDLQHEVEHLKQLRLMLMARLGEEQLKTLELEARLHLSNEEKRVLQGENDGCVRVNKLRPIIERVFGLDV